jgi:hypothetical protein
MEGIGPRTIQKMKDTAIEKIDAWAPNIRDAFIKSDDGKLKVSLSYNIFMSKDTPGGLDIKAGISFIESRINDETISTVVENQADLPLDAKVYKLSKE